MTKRKDKILELVTDGVTREEVIRKLKISDQIFRKQIVDLQREGHNIIRQIYYNGIQKYVLQKSIPDNISHIIGVPKNGLFRVIAASDYHIGSKRQNIQFLNRIYEFANNNDIHIILNCGDLIEGLLNTPFHTSYYDQIEYLLENHPHDENITNLIVLGNHDADLLKNTGLDLHKILNENRNDLISLGYGPQKIGILNNEIIMCHSAKDIRNDHAKLKLTGHGHRYHFNVDNGEPTIFLPTASNNIYDDFPPGFIDIQIEIKDGLFYKGTFYFYTLKRNQVIKICYTKFHYENSYPTQEKILSKFQ